MFVGVLTTFLMQKQTPEVFYKKGALTNFAKFIGKRLCQSFFFNEVTGLRLATLSKMELWHRCFPVNFAKFVKASFLQNASGRLVLLMIVSRRPQPSKNVPPRKLSDMIKYDQPDRKQKKCVLAFQLIIPSYQYIARVNQLSVRHMIV